jgi:hypothetical protein
VLSQLRDRGGVDPVKAARAHLAMWRLLWGNAGQPGMLAGLTGAQRKAADDVIAAGRLRAKALRAVAYSYPDVSVDVRVQVREVTRHFAEDVTFALSQRLVQDAAGPLNATDFLAQLWTVAARLGPDEVIRYTLAPFGLPASAARWQQQRVIRRGSAPDVRSYDATVWELDVHAATPDLTAESAVEALGRFAQASEMNDQYPGYWRIRFRGPAGGMVFWDELAEDGVCLIDGVQSDLSGIERVWPAWWTRFAKLYAGVPKPSGGSLSLVSG